MQRRRIKYMNFANIKYNDIANGTGVRTTLFVSGCDHRCKGCFNEVAWDYNYGRPFDKNMEKNVVLSLIPDYIEGLSILGGEPLAPKNQKAVSHLVDKAKKLFPNKNIWIYSGYTYEELSASDSPFVKNILQKADVLVDGKFELENKDITLKFRGSSNQRVIDLKKSTVDSISCLF